MDLPGERSHNDFSFEGKPTALLFCRCAVAAVSPGMPPLLLSHWHTVLSRCARAEEGGVPHRFTSLVSSSHLLWHEGRGIIQAAVSEAAGGLRNFPLALLDTQGKLKEPLNVVGVAIGSYGLEQQVTDCRR